MRNTRVSFDWQNARRDRRYPLPNLVVTIDGRAYDTENWSLGGFLVSGFDRRVRPGQAIAGKLGLADQPVEIDFTATVVRGGDETPGQLAAQFTDLSDETMTLLERIITRRLFRG
jgi:hypothetical protein